MKKVLGFGLALLASQATANTFEVSLFYPDSYDSDSNFEVSTEVVGFYRSLELGNALLSDHGVNLTLKPIGVYSTNSWGSSETVSWGQATMQWDGGSGVDIETDIGDMAVGVFEQTGSAIALAQAMLSSYYTTHPTGTRKIAMGHSVMLGTDDQTALPYVLTHEILHTIGGEHESSDDFNDDGFGRTDGYGKVCGNGYSSLMHTSISSTPFSDVTMTGDDSDCPDANANMVNFTNHYAPLAANYAATVGNQTVSVAVSEDIDNQVFTFQATRLNTTNAETMKLYIAGGYVNSGNTSLEPINITFDAGQTQSQTIEVTFTDLHPLFEQANESVQSVYAVVIGSDEVQDASVDVMALNTQWTDEVVTPPTTDPTEPTEPTTPSQGGSGGGSMPLWLLPALLLVRLLRK
ncbi:gammaproteobacterial enzyme C- transmembrane domain protein [Vibrio sp. R78045]|uniref:gammaproteobacterial enzyme C- transmembrane domain protein n=1 Tax=Vibrio sp. R78045 TaxID=3093868 RepID=UPI0036F2E87F